MQVLSTCMYTEMFMWTKSIFTCTFVFTLLGLFSTIGDISILLQHLMFAEPTDAWINSTTVLTFTTVNAASTLAWIRPIVILYVCT